MPRFLQSSIDEVLRRCDLAEIASSYVQLKRNGTDFVGLCPFHREKTPSFHISSDKQLFYCFGCGAGGNLIDFIMKIENLDFVDCIKFLADRSGVMLEEEIYSPAVQQRHDQRERMLKLNKLAAKRFMENLSHETAKHALAYAKDRGLSRSIITAFGIGFAKDSWNDLTSYLNEQGYKNDELVAAGLAVKNDKGHVYDKFRNRLMFPIIDVRKNVIAFGGRALGDDPAKYMNSPETLVYHKGDHVFGLNVAKNTAMKDGLILVEGYMDAVTLHTFGFPNAIAGLGTAFTEGQASLLKRYCSTVYLCYDSDDAGQKATERAIDVLTAAGLKIRIVSYTGAKDPDELVRKKGAESFKAVLAASLSPTEYRVLRVRKDYQLADTADKVEFLEKAAAILAQNPNAMEREVYAKRIAKETDISPESILGRVNQLIYQKQRKDLKVQERRVQSVADAGRSQAEKATATSVYKAERMLLNLMFFDAPALRIAKNEITAEELSDPVLQSLFSAILSFKEETEDGSAPMFLAGLRNEEKSVAADILYKEYTGNSSDAIRDNITKIKKHNLKERINRLAQEGNIDEINRLIQKENERRQGK